MIITIASLKGGTGKSSTAMALASAVVAAGYRALVLDADPQGSATQWAMAAEDAGGLPFEVDSCNMFNIQRKSASAAGSDDEWVFVDCPPSGDIIDRAAEIADMVVIPTGTGAADLAKAMAVVASMRAAGTFHAVLVTQARTGTVALNATLMELAEGGVSSFETVIPLREGIRAHYGNPFGEELYGYTELFAEIREGLVR